MIMVLINYTWVIIKWGEKMNKDFIARYLAGNQQSQINSINNDIEKIKDQIDGVSFWTGSKTDYNNIINKNNNTIYIINDNDKSYIYIGDSSISKLYYGSLYNKLIRYGLPAIGNLIELE